MNAEQTAALNRFLATLAPTQRVALMDVLGMHTENVLAEDPCFTDDEHEDFDFIVTVERAVVDSIAA